MHLLPLLRNASLGLLFVAASAQATIYEIQTTSDDASLNGNCTLREAIRAAAGNAPVDQCPAGTATDIIGLPAGTYGFTLGDELLSGSGVDITIIGATGEREDVTINLALANRFLRLENLASVTLEDLSVALGKPDDVGGVIHAEDSSVELINVNLSLNQATGLGGAVAFNSFGTPSPVELVIRGSLFSGNVAREPGGGGETSGGGVRAYIDEGSTAEIVDSEFVENRVDGDTLGGIGGGLFLTTVDDSAALVARNLFDGNRLETDGSPPAVGFGGGASIAAFGNAVVDVQDNVFVGNVADDGGAGLQAFGTGLRLYSDDGARLTADRNTIQESLLEGSATSDSSQVYLLAESESELVFASSLVADTHSGGMRGVRIVSESQATLRMTNLTVTGHAEAGISGSDAILATTSIANSIVFDNSPNLSITGLVFPTDSLIGVDPDFVNAAGGDYRVSAGSDAIDGGDQSADGVGRYDVAHATRVIGADVDIGAFEFTGIFADGFDLGDDSAWDVVVGALE